MAIEPPRLGLSNAALVPTLRNRGGGAQQKVADTPEARAMQAERESQERIEQAQRQTETTESDLRRQLDQARDQYEKEYANETDRQESAIEAEKMKGYERLRALKMQQDAEYTREKREGDKQLNEMRTAYRDQEFNADRQGREDLTKLNHMNNQQLEYQKSSAGEMMNEEKSADETRLTEMKQREDYKYGALMTKYKGEYENAKQHTEDVRAHEDERFKSQYQQDLTEHNRQLSEIEGTAAKKIREIREDTADQLDAYSSRQGDPFYRMVDIGARLHDRGDEYVLTATIPDYEQNHVSVSVNGDQLVVSGYRRNEEKLDLGEGRKEGTSSFQSFEQSFPLTWPVVKKELSKTFEGDTLVVRVPKYQSYSPYRMKEKAAKEPQRLAVERPQFPKNISNLELEKHRAERKLDENGNPLPDPGTPGSASIT